MNLDEITPVIRSYHAHFVHGNAYRLERRALQDFVLRREWKLYLHNDSIVLATPDDEGYLAGFKSDKKYRMRQNVVFEIGMLFFALERNITAIIVKEADKIDIPSDIAGIKRIQYKEHISEVEKVITKELEAARYQKRKTDV